MPKTTTRRVRRQANIAKIASPDQCDWAQTQRLVIDPDSGAHHAVQSRQPGGRSGARRAGGHRQGRA